MNPAKSYFFGITVILTLLHDQEKFAKALNNRSFVCMHVNLTTYLFDDNSNKHRSLKCHEIP